VARSESGRHSRRRLVLGAVLAVALVLALVGGTWCVARMTESPAQRDAAAAAPSAAPVTATVAVGDLRDEITAQGTIVAAQTTTASLTLRDEDRSVVTSANVRPGQTISPGQALMRVNGRPVIILPGAFPTYRNLVQGDQGDDVAQLQQALAALGYGVSADGDFGPATAAALTALYRDLGSTVATTSAEAPATAQAADTNNNQSGDGTAGSTSTSADTSSNAGSDKRTTTKTLVTLPQSEVVFVPSLEAGTSLVSAPGVGTVLTEDNAKITLSSGSPHIEAEVPDSVATALDTNTTATALVDGSTVNLIVTDKHKKAEDDTAEDSSSGVGGAQIQNTSSVLTLMPADDTVLPAPSDDAETLLLTIQRNPTITNALLVPKRALSTTDATATVIKLTDGTASTETVTVLGCVGGQCAIDADGPVTEGDALRVDGT